MFGVSSFCLHKEPLASALEKLTPVTDLVEIMDDGPHFIAANIEAGRAEAPPLKYDELENKYRFIRYVEDTEGKSILRIPQSASNLMK